MTKIIFVFPLLLAILFLTKKQDQKCDLEYFISNRFVTDSSDVEVILKNNSSKNYYLFLDTLSINDEFAKFNFPKFLMWSDLRVSDPAGELADVQIEDYNCHNNSLYSTSKRITTKSFLKIKARQSVTFKVPFKIKTSINNYCWQKYVLEDRNNKNYYSIYFESRVLDVWDSKNSYKIAQDSLRKMGYELHNKNIKSNKVPLIFK